MYLGIEIGGTKLQLGVGRGDGALLGLWRAAVVAADGAEGIRRQIVSALPELCRSAGVGRGELLAAGVGFGGPIDDRTRAVVTSHQIAGWDGFPLADWLAETTGLAVALGNDADVAGLAEASHGAGKGFSPVFYVTVGTGIGGGLVVDGKIQRGVGRGAAEIGHLRLGEGCVLEDVASGSAIERRATARAGRPMTVRDVARLAAGDDPDGAAEALDFALEKLAEALCHVIALVCPARIVIGGGVSLIGEGLFFAPLRRLVAERTFRPFAGLTAIAPAALGEEVVVHGAIDLARGPG